MRRGVCLALVFTQLVVSGLAHEHGGAAHLHLSHLLPCHDDHDADDPEPDHDDDAVYFPLAVSAMSLPVEGPAACPLDGLTECVAFLPAFAVPADPPEPVALPPPRAGLIAPGQPLFLTLRSLRC